MITNAIVLAVLVSSSFPGWAKGVADQATGQYAVKCESKVKPEAVYECALLSAVAVGAISADVLRACQNDLGAGPVDKPNFQLWICARLRQFGQKMPVSEWRTTTHQDCNMRSRRPGHRYLGNPMQCVVDAIMEQRRVPAAEVEGCRQSKAGARGAHGLLNCLSKQLVEPS